MFYLYIFIGGGLGSLLRYIITKISDQTLLVNFPIGTFISNMLACLMLAILVVYFSAKSLHYSWIEPLLIIGFCGGFSTFSTFSNENFKLFDQGYIILPIVNMLISVTVGFLLIYFIRSKS